MWPLSIGRSNCSDSGRIRPLCTAGLLVDIHLWDKAFAALRRTVNMTTLEYTRRKAALVEQRPTSARRA